MSPTLRLVAKKTGLYNIDEYGVRNYSTRFISFVSVTLLSLLVLLFGYVTYLAEMNTPDSNITNYGDAVWMMLMSATTIGFGDHYPVTFIGRIAVILMFVLGVGIFGAMGALFAGKLLGFTDTRVKNRVLRKQNAEILKRMKHVNRELQQIKRDRRG